jgi:hypothetical protein
MLYAFWLARGLVLPRAANKEAPLPDARLLGYSMAVTLEEKLGLVELLLLQESGLMRPATCRRKARQLSARRPSQWPGPWSTSGLRASPIPARSCESERLREHRHLQSMPVASRVRAFLLFVEPRLQVLPFGVGTRSARGQRFVLTDLDGVDRVNLPLAGPETCWVASALGGMVPVVEELAYPCSAAPVFAVRRPFVLLDSPRTRKFSALRSSDTDRSLSA